VSSRRIVAAGAVASVALVAFLAIAAREDDSRARAAGAQKANAGPAPRTADGKVDFSGIRGPVAISSTTCTMR